MSLSPAKHYYSKAAVEAWFRRLTRDWECYFSQDQLKMGRQIYLDDGIRELELTVDDAIVHTRTEDKAYYSVISWDKLVPQVRSSTRKIDRGKSIAVAGLYQIEELISEKLDELSVDEPVEAVLSPGLEDGGASSGPEDGSDGLRRPLVLVFSGDEDGLGFHSYWLNPDGSRAAALVVGNSKAPRLTEGESEALIRLTTLAGRAGFVLDRVHGRFSMSDIGRFVPFLTHVLPKWKEHFTVLRESEVKRLMQGIQDVRMEAFVEERLDEEPDGSEFTRYEIDWKFHAGGAVLNPHEAALLTRKPGQPVFIPQRGIVQLTHSQISLMDRLAEFRREVQKGRSERYMVLSVFGEGDHQIKLSRGLVQWRKKLFSEPKPVARAGRFLRSYQKRGIEWMAHVLRSGCHPLLADEMGLGKTVQILGLLKELMKGSNKPSVVFSPASVVPVWMSEIKRFYPALRFVQITGARSLAELDKSSVDVILCSYTLFRRNAEAFSKIAFKCAILDEAQVIKNPETKVSRAAYGLNAEWRIAMSGTPIENHYKDVWSLFYFLMPGLLGSRTRFEAQVEAGGAVFQEKLRNQLAPFILRRTKEEVVSELPAKNEMQLNCGMTELQRKEYNRLLHEGIKRLNTDGLGDTFQKRSFNMLALITRLRQVCCDPGLLPWMETDPMKSGKIQLMVEKLADILDGGHKVVIFSQFVGLITRLKEVIDQSFPNVSLFTLTGKTVDREKPVSGFQNAPNPAVMLVSLRAGGTGITLSSADYVFLMDPWWNPSVENQAIDRVHRIGQKNPVFVYRVISAGTVEDRVQSLQHEKREMFRHLIEDLKDVSHHPEHLNSLRDLLALQ